MKRGTAAKVILGKDTIMDVPAGIVHGTDVILGGKAGLLNDFGGLVLSNNLMIGKKVSRGTITTITVRGQSPLVLPDAIAGSLQAVKAFGGIEQNGTPTPDAPVDIVSNNGALKARRQSGLPLGYTLLEHIKSTGTQYIDTGINGSQITRFVVKGTCTPNGSSNSQLLGGTSATASTFFGARVISGVINWYCVDGTKSLGDPTHLSIIDCAIESASSQPGTLTDTTTGTTQAFTKLAGGNWGFDSENLLLFGGDATRRSTNATCCYLQLYTSGGLAFSGVPCMRNSDNVVGVYDLVSGQFFTNQGTGDFVAGATVDDIEVYADGTVETINVHGKNLFDKNDINLQYNNRSLSTTQDGYWFSSYNSTSLVCRCLPNTQYTISGINLSTTIFRVATIDVDTLPSNQDTNDIPYSYIYRTTRSEVYTFITPSTAKWIVVQVSNTVFNSTLNTIQIEQGSTATDYEPYFNGGTATAEMLLKVDDYQDEHAILSGAVTRKVGIKVFDGSETFINGNNGWVSEDAITDQLNTKFTPFCTHFRGVTTTPSANSNTVRVYLTSNLTQRVYFGLNKSIYTSTTVFQQWLADQYAAGTPVIIVYPLATPTTESVTGQTLQVQDGDNTLEITQASLTGLELEATYKSLVQLTIQEVEDANLNNNVEVTIS